jgi:hypothetical protein
VTEHEHVSDLRFDRLLASELAADAKAEVLAAAGACSQCGERLQALTREREAFAQRPPLLLPRARRTRWWLAAPTVLAAAAAVVLVVRARGGDNAADRTKGDGVSLVVAAGSPGSMAVVASGDRVQPGDSVQVGYSAPRAGYGAVLGLDGSGAVSAYVPWRRDTMVALPAGDDQVFPESTVLDGVLGDETLIALWCERSHELRPLLAELSARGDVAAPSGCTVRRVVLRKEPR